MTSLFTIKNPETTLNKIFTVVSLCMYAQTQIYIDFHASMVS